MNQTPTPVAVPAIVLRRTYAAPRQRVFDAWTTPALAARFLGPPGGTTPDVAMDARTGGTYRIVFVRADGERLPVGGTYREVLPPERIVMTWRWEEDDAADEYDSLVTLEFNEVADGTEVVLTHAHIASAKSRERHEEGWTFILERLASAV
jgi:uncharacterized protein YndB with AHSA1/START domain